MSRPKLLDLFCGAGGAAVGYHRAGFDVTGWDIVDHPDYPFKLHVGDALQVDLDGYDAVHASPPCPLFSVATGDRNRPNHVDLLTPMLARLRDWDGLWIVENVPGAPLPSPTLICGRAMGLRWTRRHRLFAASIPLMSPGCACGGESPYGVTGDSPERRDYSRNGRKARSIEHAQAVMGIDWMTTWDDLTDAIPPVFTEYLGAQLLDHVRAAA